MGADDRGPHSVCSMKGNYSNRMEKTDIAQRSAPLFCTRSSPVSCTCSDFRSPDNPVVDGIIVFSAKLWDSVVGRES